jgi:hypothetical protein
MVTRRGEKVRDAVIRAENECDRRTYRASIVWDRKWIAVEEASLIPDQMEIERHAIFAEAWIWRGGWLNLIFRPTLVLGYSPTEPTDPRPANFRELTWQIITECDLTEIASGEVDGQLRHICAPYRIWPIFGYRRHLWTRRRVSHVLLFGWPEGRPFPQ